MRITFLLPGIRILGGVRTIFEYSNRLLDRGYDVSIVHPLSPMTYKSTINKILGTLINLRDGNRIDWFDLRADLIRVLRFNEGSIPDSDIIVATWWNTAYYINKYSKNKGEKFYLIQHYEIWGGPREMVDGTYRLGLHNIVVSTWLKNILEGIGAKVDALILNGVNLDEFYPEHSGRDDNEIRILMPYRKEEWKGVKDGLKALEIVKMRYKNIKLVMFGPRARRGELPDDVEFHLLPTGDKLRRVYNSCDIFCFPSRMEGFGLPPMEAMACKIPVVTTNVGAVPDYIIPEKTALVSPPNNPEALAQNIIRLIENEKKSKKIAERGYNHIKQFTWDKATDKLERIFWEHIEHTG